MIKYLGSKRALMPVLESLINATGAKSAVDLFTGTTRVAAAMKRSGMHVSALDTASYSEVFSKTFIELDGASVEHAALATEIDALNSLPGDPGYFTEVFCQKARFFRPENGQRIDAIRSTIEANYKDSWMYHPLLASLLIAADKVDSTTGVQMAYLKSWSRRSALDIELKMPELLPGAGQSLRGDANDLVNDLPSVELAYVDPPYNQHRYFGNYHIWETLVRWDGPEYYGIANKRIDTRLSENKSDFNSKLTMQKALETLISKLRTETLILSYNNESWLSRRELADMCNGFEVVKILDFDFKRYVGSQIGGYNQSGELVGKPGARRNVEHLVIAGAGSKVEAMTRAIGH